MDYNAGYPYLGASSPYKSPYGGAHHGVPPYSPSHSFTHGSSHGSGGGGGHGLGSHHLTSAHFSSVPHHGVVDAAALDAKNSQIASLQSEVEALRMQARTLESSASSLKHSLSTAESRLHENAPKLQQLVAGSAEASRQIADKDGLIRELRSQDMEARTAITTLQQEVHTMKRYEDQLRNQLDIEKRAAADALDRLRSDHARELAAAAKDKETAAGSGQQRASDLEATISRLQADRERDRDALADAQKDARTLDGKISKLKDDVERRDDLVGMHEKEGRVKQKRIDEALLLVAALQANVDEVEADHRRTLSDLEIRLREAEMLKKEGETLRESLKTEQSKTSKWAKAYAALGGSLGATELDIRGMALDSTASRLVGDLASTQKKVVKAELDLAKKKNDVEMEKLKATEAIRDRDTARETASMRQDEVAILQEDLLHSTQELRGAYAGAAGVGLAATVPVGTLTTQLVGAPPGAAPHTLTNQWASLSAQLPTHRRWQYTPR